MLRTVKFLSTFSCVSLRDMKETGAASRPVPPNHSDIRRAQVLQPPDSSSDILRGSSLIAEQWTLVSYINTPVCVKDFFKFFWQISRRIRPAVLWKKTVPAWDGGEGAASGLLSPCSRRSFVL